MTITPQLARLSARIYAICAILVGLAVIGAVLFLIAVFGFRPADWEFLVIGVGLASAFIVLGFFIWRQQTWAMLAALALSVAIRFMFGNETLMLNVALSSAAVLCAVLTGLHLSSNGRPASG